MALFQAVFPDTYIEPCASSTPTYTIEEGEMLDKDSRKSHVVLTPNKERIQLTIFPALTPFHRNAQGDFWTSANSRNIRDMGYTYPELASNPSNATLVASIKAQYSDAASSKVTATRQDTSAAEAPSKGRIYLAEVHLPVFGFADGQGSSQPYNVLLFLGDVPADPKEWLDAESFVSVTSTIGGKHMDNNQSTIITVDLSAQLEKSGKAGDSEDSVVEWLKENLHWRLGLVSLPVSSRHALERRD
jgi:tyrosinase